MVEEEADEANVPHERTGREYVSNRARAVDADVHGERPPVPILFWRGEEDAVEPPGESKVRRLSLLRVFSKGGVEAVHSVHGNHGRRASRSYASRRPPGRPNSVDVRDEHQLPLLPFVKTSNLLQVGDRNHPCVRDEAVRLLRPFEEE